MAICRNFLWTGKAAYSKAPLVAWELVCRPKKEGGLGIHNVYDWNKAAVAKLVWHIAQNKESLWMQWVNHLYLKGRNWKRYKCPASTSWSWKQIWKIKEMFKEGYQGSTWKNNAAGYTISSGYLWLQEVKTEVPWANWIWNRLNIPKHRFISWLAVLGKLQVKAKLARLGITADDDRCPLCHSVFLTGYCVFLGRSLISWKTKKQKTVSKSSAEAEYRCMPQTTSEVVWIDAILEDLGFNVPKPIDLFCDNKAAHHIAHNAVFHERTKHLKIDCHYVRDHIQSGFINALHIKAFMQLGDLMTKSLSEHQHKNLSFKLGLLTSAPTCEGETQTVSCPKVW